MPRRNPTHAKERSVESIPTLAGGSLLGHVDEFKSNPLHLLTRAFRECGEVGRFRLLNRWVVLIQNQ